MHILVVDDEIDIRNLIQGILEDEGYQSLTAHHSEEALKQLSKEAISLVLLDVWLGASDCLSLLVQIKTSYPTIPVIMMSGHGTFEIAVTSIKNGAYDFIEKPFLVDRLLLAITNALRTSRLIQENALLKHDVSSENFLTDSSSSTMRQIHTTIKNISPSNNRILILGEPGVGKKQFSQNIHLLSKDSSEPFTTLNCIDLNTNFESILLGLFNKNPTGTFVFKEISDLTLETQKKFIQILEDQNNQQKERSIRVLTTSRLNLKELVELELFREDLYYHISAFTIHIPPLRSRKEDIFNLAQTILKTSFFPYKEKIHFSLEVLSAFQRYHWPGNIHELKNVIERTFFAIYTKYQHINFSSLSEVHITLDMLPQEIQELATPNLPAQIIPNLLNVPLKKAREIFETQYLLAQISQWSGNVTKTAEFIGMERAALHRKLRSLNINKKKEPEDSSV